MKANLRQVAVATWITDPDRCRGHRQANGYHRAGQSAGSKSGCFIFTEHLMKDCKSPIGCFGYSPHAGDHGLCRLRACPADTESEDNAAEIDFGCRMEGASVSRTHSRTGVLASARSPRLHRQLQRCDGQAEHDLMRPVNAETQMVIKVGIKAGTDGGRSNEAACC